MQIIAKPVAKMLMSAQISCPRCNSTIDPQAHKCPNCGVELGLAAALAEQGVLPPETLKAPEALVPRLGEYLIEKGELHPADLQRALLYQQQRATGGQPILIGQALVELGMVDRVKLDAAVTEQILRLQTTLQQINRQLEQRVRERTADLQRALTRLTELNQLKSNFISNVSHELRTPLTHIRGYLDILAEGSLGPLTSQQAEALQVLLRAESRLEQLIDDLIQFSLAARGELTTNMRSFQLAGLIAIAIQQSKHKAAARQVTLHCSMADNLPPVWADEEKISWAMMQLLDNAIKFNHPGGRVAVEVNQEDGSLTVSVIDTGVGIPEERIAEIFEPFHQLDGSITRRYAGTGLGLAMVHRILEAHGSPIRVRSEVGKGSRFEFHLLISRGEYG